MSSSLADITDAQIKSLMTALDSLVDGELAITILIACGQRAVPYLERYLLTDSPRSIALPRCRAVHILGELGAYSTLISYLQDYELPADPIVLFAEDAVRSAVARELLRWKSDEVFRVLLEASQRRVTNGIVLALGEFRRKESIPQLFDMLADDLCREEAKDALRKVPNAARQYALLSLRGETDAKLHGLAALCARRAVMQLLFEFGVSPDDWPVVKRFLQDSDPDVVISTTSIGFQIGPEEDYEEGVQALFRVAKRVNWFQETEVEELLDDHPELARAVARDIANQRKQQEEHINWLVPSWRILKHVLGQELEGYYGTA